MERVMAVSPVQMPVENRDEQSTRLATVPHFIHGERKPGVGTRTAPVWNPSLGTQSSVVSLASPRDVDAAVSSATQGFAEWSTWSALKRARVLFRFRELLESNATELATILSSDHA